MEQTPAKPTSRKQFQKILDEVAAVKDTVCCCIVSLNGAILAEHLPEGLDAEFLGLSALAVYGRSTAGIRAMNHLTLHQIVLKTAQGYTVIAGIGNGLLVTMTKESDDGPPIKVLQKITQQLSQTKEI